MTLRHHPGVTWVQTSVPWPFASPRSVAVCATCGWHGPTRETRVAATIDGRDHENAYLAGSRKS